MKFKKGKCYAMFGGPCGISYGKYIGRTPVGLVFESSPFASDACHLKGTYTEELLDKHFLLELPSGDAAGYGWPTESECLAYIRKVLPE